MDLPSKVLTVADCRSGVLGGKPKRENPNQGSLGTEYLSPKEVYLLKYNRFI